jgi:hypothetical protein
MKAIVCCNQDTSVKYVGLTEKQAATYARLQGYVSFSLCKSGEVQVTLNGNLVDTIDKEDVHVIIE